MVNKRSYSELSRLRSFDDRFDYLAVNSSVGLATFAFERYLNQRFYTSREWRQVRNHCIARDRGLDLGVDGYEIYDKIVVHHMNPMTIDDVIDYNPEILDPEFLITTTHDTHNAIHYGSKDSLPNRFTERAAGDTKLW
mgnify:CR=1 FL=1